MNNVWEILGKNSGTLLEDKLEKAVTSLEIISELVSNKFPKLFSDKINYLQIQINEINQKLDNYQMQSNSISTQYSAPSSFNPSPSPPPPKSMSARSTTQGLVSELKDALAKRRID
ncbi:MAG: hypothetical protein PHT91_01260 [Candidatus Nanoarchaeia archaeon]|nr:hypothetical protein [Candidatus Nanoarchaeia archaeon]MDD5054113.1 hypothetical protein [Candidatus Nanoarchaeia archaeon]MDD5499487.1 hypothetical protein [Candidatus Nanoarchaeia archaeon]